jgi:xylulokinase
MSSSANLILTIDLGTSGPKVSVFDSRAQMIDYEFAEVPMILIGEDGREQKPSDWVDTIRACYNAIRQRGKFDPKDIIALNITTQWSGTVAVDQKGEPLMNSIIWMDSRGAPYAQKLMHGPIRIDGYGIGKALKWVRITGAGPSPSGKDSISHILYIKDKLPEIYKKTYKFLEPKDYLNLYFTGKFAASYDSITVHWITDNRDINNIKYSDELIKLTGVDKAKLPDLIKSNSLLGTMKKDIAADWGLRDDVKVISGTPDTHSAAIGSGAVKDFEPHLYIGTSSWLICHAPWKKTDIFHQMGTIPAGIPGKYLLVNEQETTGACLNFIKNNIFYYQDELQTENAPADFYQRMDRVVEKVPAGSNGVIFTPWLNGERSPVDDHHARGGFYNLSLSTNRTHMLRAVFEGIACNNRWLLGYAEKLCGKKFEAINFIGGGANSDVWCQILADVFDRPVKQMNQPLNANSRGAAFLALMSLGMMKIEEVAALAEVKHVYQPNPAHRKLYDELFSRYVEIYDTNKGLFKRWNR